MKILEALGASDWPLEIGGQQPRATEIWRNYTDNDDAHRLLGWRPRVTLEEGLRLTFKQPVREEHTSIGRGASAGYAS